MAAKPRVGVGSTYRPVAHPGRTPQLAAIDLQCEALCGHMDRLHQVQRLRSKAESIMAPEIGPDGKERDPQRAMRKRVLDTLDAILTTLTPPAPGAPPREAP